MGQLAQCRCGEVDCPGLCFCRWNLSWCKSFALRSILVETYSNINGHHHNMTDKLHRLMVCLVHWLRERNLVSSTLDRVFAWACAHGADAIVMSESKRELWWSLTVSVTVWQGVALKYFQMPSKHSRPPFAVNIGGLLHPRRTRLYKLWSICCTVHSVFQAPFCWAYPRGKLRAAWASNMSGGGHSCNFDRSQSYMSGTFQWFVLHLSIQHTARPEQHKWYHNGIPIAINWQLYCS